MAQPLRIRSIQAPLEARRGTLELAYRAQARDQRVYGRLEFKHPGEALFEVKFPVWFVEAPQFSFGGELTGNLSLDAGNYPKVNLMVRAWRTITRDGRDYYVGAEFVLVASGRTDMTGVAHWQCQGVALSNPTVGGG
jgi:hypothetical protein